MKIIRFKEAETVEPDKNWKRINLCNEPNLSVEYFTKPAFHASPMHEHAEQQVLIIIQGKLTAISNNQEIILEEGDSACFYPHEQHAVKNPTDRLAVGIDLFSPGRSFDFWTKKFMNQENKK